MYKLYATKNKIDIKLNMPQPTNNTKLQQSKNNLCNYEEPDPLNVLNLSRPNSLSLKEEGKEISYSSADFLVYPKYIQNSSQFNSSSLNVTNNKGKKNYTNSQSKLADSKILQEITNVTSSLIPPLKLSPKHISEEPVLNKIAPFRSIFSNNEISNNSSDQSFEYLPKLFDSSEKSSHFNLLIGSSSFFGNNALPKPKNRPSPNFDHPLDSLFNKDKFNISNDPKINLNKIKDERLSKPYSPSKNSLDLGLFNKTKIKDTCLFIDISNEDACSSNGYEHIKSKTNLDELCIIQNCSASQLVDSEASPSTEHQDDKNGNVASPSTEHQDDKNGNVVSPFINNNISPFPSSKKISRGKKSKKKCTNNTPLSADKIKLRKFRNITKNSFDSQSDNDFSKQNKIGYSKTKTNVSTTPMPSDYEDQFKLSFDSLNDKQKKKLNLYDEYVKFVVQDIKNLFHSKKKECLVNKALKFSFNINISHNGKKSKSDILHFDLNLSDKHTSNDEVKFNNYDININVAASNFIKSKISAEDSGKSKDHFNCKKLNKWWKEHLTTEKFVKANNKITINQLDFFSSFGPKVAVSEENKKRKIRDISEEDYISTKNINLGIHKMKKKKISVQQ